MAQFENHIFKANDIRGTYPDQVNDEFAYLLGSGLATALSAKRVAIGRDCRLSSPALYAALAAGLKAAGAEPGCLDLCPTELLYFLMGSRRDFDLGVMVTASHNPPHFNGFKIVGPGAEPVTERSGLKKARQWIADAAISIPHAPPPPPKSLFIEKEYARYAASVAGSTAGLIPLKVVVDPANGAGGLIWREISTLTGVEPVKMNFEPDGRFPAHEADPSRAENLRPLQEAVLANDADIGFAYDGDADRTVVVLKGGHIMDGNETTAAIVEHLFAGKPSASFAVNMTASRGILDLFRAKGIEPLIVPVGHAKIKRIMRSREDVEFAGETSGHYYYRKFFCCESSLITTLHLLHLATTGSLQALRQSMRRPWFASSRRLTVPSAGRAVLLRACRAVAAEALTMFPNPREILCEIDWQVRRDCEPTDIGAADAIRMDYEDWWFCTRPSDTEANGQIAIEALTSEDLRRKQEALLGLFSRHLGG